MAHSTHLCLYCVVIQNATVAHSTHLCLYCVVIQSAVGGTYGARHTHRSSSCALEPATVTVAGTEMGVFVILSILLYMFDIPIFIAGTCAWRIKKDMHTAVYFQL